jgi:hypothetical protein
LKQETRNKQSKRMSNNGSKVASSLVRLVNALPHSARQQKLYAAALTRVAARTEGPLFIELRGEKQCVASTSCWRRCRRITIGAHTMHRWSMPPSCFKCRTHSLPPRFPLSVELQCEISTENVSPSKPVDNDDDDFNSVVCCSGSRWHL